MLLDKGYDCVKLRSMSRPVSLQISVIRYLDNPLEYLDEELHYYILIY